MNLLQYLVEGNMPELQSELEVGEPVNAVIPNTPEYIKGVTTSEDIHSQFSKGFINLLNGHKPYN